MYRADTVKSQVIKVNINNGRQTDSIFSWSKNCTSPQWSFSPTHITWLNNEKRITQPPAEAQSTITRSCILAWRIPWTVEPGRPWSTGSQRVGHDWSNWAHGTTTTWPDILKTITLSSKTRRPHEKLLRGHTTTKLWIYSRVESCKSSSTWGENWGISTHIS